MYGVEGIWMEGIVSEQLLFEDRTAFRQWLKKNHGRPGGVWLVFGKNGAVQTIGPEEALAEALCFGWIDGLIKSVDAGRYLKFFAPRRNRSNWSEKNKKTAEKLIEDGRMASPGLQAIERAKGDGSWDSSKRLVISEKEIDLFRRMIVSNRQAVQNFDKMPQSVKKQFSGLYHEAKKEETRRRRLEKLVGLLEQNKRPM